MSADEGDEPVVGEHTGLADAVDEAMQPEVRRTFVEAYQRHIMEADTIRPPRTRSDTEDILDKLRDEEPGDGPSR